MYLDEIVAAQKRGEARGVASVCSAHPFVIQETLKLFERPLIEATCNQVNQFGGYTGMTPKDFVEYVRGIAEEIHFPFERIILGGDHLGPNVWQNEPAESAMQKSEEMIRQYVEAGFTKIHLECSMKLADDPAGMLDVEVIARRAARLAKIAEHAEAENHSAPRYVIGTEVPIPGGATEHEEGVSVTKVEDVILEKPCYKGISIMNFLRHSRLKWQKNSQRGVPDLLMISDPPWHLINTSLNLPGWRFCTRNTHGLKIWSPPGLNCL